MKWILTAAAAVAMATIVGCAGQKKNTTVVPSGAMDENPAVTNVAPPAAPTPAPAPVAVQPTTTPPVETVTPSTPTGGQTYTIKKGDTLYSIARAHYGDGKAYKKILDANPGLSPSHLKVGQVINLP